MLIGNTHECAWCVCDGAGAGKTEVKIGFNGLIVDCKFSDVNKGAHGTNVHGTLRNFWNI